jgi:hypothetical protein
VPYENDTYGFMREIELLRGARPESRDYGMSKRLEDLVTDCQQALAKLNLRYRCHVSPDCQPSEPFCAETRRSLAFFR